MVYMLKPKKQPKADNYILFEGTIILIYTAQHSVCTYNSYMFYVLAGKVAAFSLS